MGNLQTQEPRRAVKISVQMICFQAVSTLPKGMLQACVASIYPHVDQITIVEGATMCRGRFDGDATAYTKNGGSTDGTLEALFSLPDPSNKLEIVRSKGFWNGKTMMCQEAANRSTGDYLWQIDCDEFYHEDNIAEILKVLDRERPDAMHFYAFHFWGGFDHHINRHTEHRWGNDIPWKRIFRHYQGARWITHEPPEYELPDGRRCNEGNVITREMMLARGIRMYHYGYSHLAQAEFKARFYRNPTYPRLWHQWQNDHAAPLINGSQTEPFNGTHPCIVQNLISKL